MGDSSDYHLFARDEAEAEILREAFPGYTVHLVSDFLALTEPTDVEAFEWSEAGWLPLGTARIEPVPHQ